MNLPDSQRTPLRAFYYYDVSTQELVFTWPMKLGTKVPERLFVGPVPIKPEFGNKEHSALFENIHRQIHNIHAIACSKAGSDIELLDTNAPTVEATTAKQLDLFG